MISCFDNVVGYTQKDCTCNDTGRPEDYNTSHSGYYLEDGEYGVNLLIPTTICGTNNIWELLDITREQGINDFLSHFALEISKLENRVLNNKAIQIGGRSYSGYKSSSAYRGIYLVPEVYRGLVLVIDSITVRLDSAVSATLTIESEGTDQTPINITTEAKKNSEFLTSGPIRIDLSKNGNPLDLRIYYTTDTEAKAINGQLYCGSCNKGKVNWKGVFAGAGIQADLEADLEEASPRNDAYGLTINARLECDGLSWLCDVDETYWSKNSYGRLIAKAIQLYWSLKTISEILNANDINYYTTVSRETLYGKRNKIKKTLDELVPVIAVELPSTLNHCYHCLDKWGFNKSSL